MIRYDDDLPPITTNQRRREAIEAVIYSLILLALLALMAWDETRPATEWVTGRDTAGRAAEVEDRHTQSTRIER